LHKRKPAFPQRIDSGDHRICLIRHGVIIWQR
jgi:hypothetical protein